MKIGEFETWKNLKYEEGFNKGTFLGVEIALEREEFR